jgi:hypothetical protein
MVVLPRKSTGRDRAGPPRALPTHSGCSVRRGALRPHNDLRHEDGFTHGRLHDVDGAAKDQNLQHGRG